ncbi:MAG: DUF6056 family protein [Anaerovibrio sp.]|nr:DUF6056 family protein [Anaerovibrio sp.]
MWQTFYVLATIFVLMLVLNMLMPLHRDDYDYSMIYMTNIHIENFGDVWNSVVHHYFVHGGRMVTVFCLVLFLWIGKTWFDIVNGLMFVALVALIYLHAIRKTELTGNPVMLALTGLLAWLSFPHFGEVAIWKSGSTVYLWSAVPVALFLLPYNISLTQKAPNFKEWMALPMFLLGVLAGWSVENLAVTVVCTAGGIACYLYRKKRLQAWMVSGFFGAFLGAVGLLAAPGNYVRYGIQEQDEGFLLHVGNQFAGNGEMILYIFPIILLLLTSWRIFSSILAVQQGVIMEKKPAGISMGQWLIMGMILILVISYFNGSFVAWKLRDAFYILALVPAGLTEPGIMEKINNIFSGFEEMAIYWLVVFLIYSVVKTKMGFDRYNRMILAQNVRPVDIWNRWPSVRYAGSMIALAIFNNLVMLAAPTFPARATFSSVGMIIIAAISVMHTPEIGDYFGKYARPALYAGAVGIGMFTMVSALVVMNTVYHEESLRTKIVQEAASDGAAVVSLEPIQITNRALRHVFFVDYDNAFSKKCLCNYYGIDDIQLKGK